eukprot:jgi/Mesvir1/5714/Mv02457-RA.1
MACQPGKENAPLHLGAPEGEKPRVFRLNEGPPPSRVLVPREYVLNALQMERDMMDAREKSKKEKDAARERYARLQKKLDKQRDEFATALQDKEAVIELLKGRLSALETRMVNSLARPSPPPSPGRRGSSSSSLSSSSSDDDTSSSSSSDDEGAPVSV